MINKVIISFGLSLILLAGYYASKTSKESPFLIKEGRYPMTVQFISDTTGFVNVIERNDSLLVEGSSISSDSSAYILMNGYINTNVPDSFQFIGRIKMFAFKECCGLIDKTGTWTFRRMDNRTFFRLKERDNLCSCDTCCIYLDIHTKK